MTWTAKAATLQQGRIPYLDTGDPQSPHVLVLVHAFPVGMRMWEPLTVPEGWRAVAPALPGFDGADPPAADSTRIDDYARLVLDFMNQLRIDSAVLAGVSMGGYTAFALWRLERLRWRGLVLADTRAGADTEEGRAGRERMLQTLAARGVQGVADEMIPKLLGKTSRERRPQLLQHVRRLIERQTNQGVAAALVRLRDRPDSKPLLPDISVPVLVVVGDEDEVTPPAEAEYMKAHIEDARLQTIADAGHLASMETPAAFNQALAAFLGEIKGN